MCPLNSNLIFCYHFERPNTVERDALTYYRFRVTSWLIGVALAIVYAKYLKKRELFKMSSKVLVTAYAYCVVVVALIVWNLSYMTDSHVTPSTVHNALFDSFSRLFWASAIALIIFICISKNGGPVNRILAAPIWRPLAKLSFCIYVLNYDIQVLKLGRNRTTVYMNNITLVIILVYFDFYDCIDIDCCLRLTDFGVILG